MPSDPTREFEAIISREVSRLDVRFDDLVRAVKNLMGFVILLMISFALLAGLILLRLRK